jgi:hypothetical protein
MRMTNLFVIQGNDRFKLQYFHIQIRVVITQSVEPVSQIGLMLLG